MASEQPPAPLHPDDEDEGGVPSWAKIGVVLAVLVGSVVALLLGSGTGDPFVYSESVETVMGDPGPYMNRELRVEGDLRQGSVLFREDPCEWRFVIEKAEQEMAVRFPQCVVPDTFRDDFGITVTVEGRLQDDGSFLASKVVPRCPSKYEMQERLEAGEAMPHADPTEPGADRAEQFLFPEPT
ncbi:MAG: cytochrome c maturation protein CcmE [Myxococcota bacterium]